MTIHQDTTTLERFQSATGLPSLRQAAREALAEHRNNPFKARLRFHRMLMKNEQLLFALETQFLCEVADEHTEVLPVPIPVQVGEVNLDTRSVPIFKTHVVSHLRRVAQRAVARDVAATILDTFLIRDGRAIGDVKWYELRRLQSENAYEAAVIKKIRQRFSSVADENAPVRDLIKASDLAKILKETKEMVRVGSK